MSLVAIQTTNKASYLLQIVPTDDRVFVLSGSGTMEIWIGGSLNNKFTISPNSQSISDVSCEL